MIELLLILITATKCLFFLNTEFPLQCLLTQSARHYYSAVAHQSLASSCSIIVSLSAIFFSSRFISVMAKYLLINFLRAGFLEIHMVTLYTVMCINVAIAYMDSIFVIFNCWHFNLSATSKQFYFTSSVLKQAFKTHFISSFCFCFR